jgi:hypothetical protein
MVEGLANSRDDHSGLRAGRDMLDPFAIEATEFGLLAIAAGADQAAIITPA